MPRHSQSAAILSDGFRIAYQQWQGAAAGTGTGSAGGVGKRCLCLHGWLDNSSSFSVLGPYLADRGYTVVAIDHVGHGHSSHTSHDQMNQFSKYVFHVKEMLKELEWDSATLIGHRYVCCYDKSTLDSSHLALYVLQYAFISSWYFERRKIGFIR
jgi:pimeloyl-ACP methyl ester carboxylesterase